jgi:hypothetical protein
VLPKANSKNRHPRKFRIARNLPEVKLNETKFLLQLNCICNSVSTMDEKFSEVAAHNAATNPGVPRGKRNEQSRALQSSRVRSAAMPGKDRKTAHTQRGVVMATKKSQFLNHLRRDWWRTA